MTADDVIDEGWRFASIGFESQPVDVGGIDLWQVEWERTGTSIAVAHPQYPDQLHHLTVYKSGGPRPPVVFAAGEFNNGVWGFYVPT